MKINAKSEKYGLIGHPTGHSLSPLMHNANFLSLEDDAFYFAYDINPDDFEKTVPLLFSLFKGFNITVPYKEKIIPFLTEIDEAASLIKAVNTVKITDSDYIGTNTDWSGFRDSLRYDYNLNLTNKNWLIIGAGGAARSAVYAAIQEKASSITLINRTLAKASKISNDFSSFYKLNIAGIDSEDYKMYASEADLIVNTTSIGLNKNDQHFFNFSSIQDNNPFIYDMVYSSDTDFLNKARSKQLKTGTGLGMLARQGANAYEFWFNKKPDIKVFLDTLDK